MASVANDLSIYEKHASDWWNPKSHYFRSLQSITPFRIQLIRNWFGDIEDKTIVDFGCGGGLISIPLIELGAHVIGIDLSPSSIECAKKRANGKGEFICADLNNNVLQLNRMADFAILADVVDHTPDYQHIFHVVSHNLKPSGKLFVSTINRTFKSWLMAILLGENLRLVPKGTHDHDLFITPAELKKAAYNAGFSCIGMIGDEVNIYKTIAKWAISMQEGEDLSVSYSALFVKDN